ncbi:hypothetical protein LshimejAT787_1502370 [Lyophyllum shimeji]|uniref:No apical meristem-associated C-terminal domain-containing protein n=1 Tax=Lyophyllum shimeji TaxID=47721 RepID=A0A9P3PXX5_LYOSH|nr:hypothetical protein LshimejAT787_1502370 [Lyophyllum shimeji]
MGETEMMRTGEPTLELVLPPKSAGSCSWTESGLTEKLIASITDDKDIKQGLYPSPGAHASTAYGGGKSKTDWHWDVAVLVFESHPKYGPSIKPALDAQKNDPKMASKLRNSWAKKIKNRLKRMGEITRGYMEKMGETGAGIARECDIDMTADNKFTNRPALAEPEAPKSVLSTKHKIEETPAGKTPARGGTSKPADPAKPPKKKSKMEEFSAIVQAEEVELAKTKVEAAAMVKVESQKAVLQAKLAILPSKKEEWAEKRHMKQDMKMEKMRLMHHLQMARLQQGTSDPGPSSHATSRSSMPGSFLPDASMSTSDASMSLSLGAGLNDWEVLVPFGMFLPLPHAAEI